MADPVGSYFGGNYVPGVTAGGTQGTVPAGQQSVKTTVPGAPTHFQGHRTPFTKLQTNRAYGIGPSFTIYNDADGQQISESLYNAWVVSEQQRQQQDSGQGVNGADLKNALDQYRGAIDKSNEQYRGIMGHTPAPTPASVVGPTETAQAQQARTQQQANIGDLQATARGQGAGQQAAEARLKLALQRSTQAASGLAAQARGSERRGLRRSALLAQGDAKLDAGVQLEQLAAQERMGAQSQLGQQLQGVRSLDITAADMQNRTGLEVSRLSEDQRVANERLKLDASKAAQDAAQGLLTENARQEQLAFAREQLRIAVDQADRQFWGNLISSLLSGGAAVGAAAVTKSDVRAKEDIRPIRDADLNELAQAVRKSLATWRYKEGEGPPGERAGPMAQAIEKTKLGRTVVREMEDGRKGVEYGTLATLLAAATVKARKAAN